MKDEIGYIKISDSKTQRNHYGVETEHLTVSLPKSDVQMIIGFSKRNNLTISRAVHDLVWWGYHAAIGDYKEMKNE
jgi:hypothetical protein